MSGLCAVSEARENNAIFHSTARYHTEARYV